MYACVAVCSSLNTELEHEKVNRADAEAKQNELQANVAQQQQKIADLEGQIRDLQATKVSTTADVVFFSEQLQCIIYQLINSVEHVTGCY